MSSCNTRITLEAELQVIAYLHFFVLINKPLFYPQIATLIYTYSYQSDEMIPSDFNFHFPCY